MPERTVYVTHLCLFAEWCYRCADGGHPPLDCNHSRSRSHYRSRSRRHSRSHLRFPCHTRRRNSRSRSEVLVSARRRRSVFRSHSCSVPANHNHSRSRTNSRSRSRSRSRWSRYRFGSRVPDVCIALMEHSYIRSNSRYPAITRRRNRSGSPARVESRIPVRRFRSLPVSVRTMETVHVPETEWHRTLEAALEQRQARIDHEREQRALWVVNEREGRRRQAQRRAEHVTDIPSTYDAMGDQHP